MDVQLYDTEEKRRWEEWRINQEAAHRAHDKHHESMLELLRSTISFGVEAVRTAALINGGAAVAGLALIGAVFKDDRSLAKILSSGVELFAIGTVLAGLATGLAYLAQFFYSQYLQASELKFEHPYVFDKSAPKILRLGIAFHVLCVIAIAASCGLLCWGASRIGSAV